MAGEGICDFSFSAKTRNGVAREEFPLLEEQEVVKASGTEKASEVADTKD